MGLGDYLSGRRALRKGRVMTTPIILAYCDSLRHGALESLLIGRGLRWAWGIGQEANEVAQTDELAILLGVGRVGCEAVARKVSEDPRNIAAVVLVDPVAPWAERPRHLNPCPVGKHCEDPYCHYKGNCSCGVGDDVPRLPLGPLEPLREVVEIVREGDCANFKSAPGSIHSTTCVKCMFSLTLHNRHEPGTRIWSRPGLRLVIACHPEPVACAECGGSGQRTARLDDGTRVFASCKYCRTGKALGSAEVASELLGAPLGHPTVAARFTRGGLTIIQYSSREALNSRAIGEALRAALA